MKDVNKRVLAIAALLIVTIGIACFVSMQRRGPMNKLLGRLSSFTVSSISIHSIDRPLREAVLDKDDQNKLIKLLRKEHYEENEDLEFVSMTGAPVICYSIHIQTKDGADILLVFSPKHCDYTSDTFEGTAALRAEFKLYKVSKDGSDEHQQVMDFPVS